MVSLPSEEVKSLYQHTSKAYKDDPEMPVACSESCMAIYEFEEVTHCIGTCTVGTADEHLDRDDDVAGILQVKCAVLGLAQQQMRILMDDTDRIMNEDPGRFRCSPWCEVVRLLQQLPYNYKSYYCVLLSLLLATFTFGLLLGGASCGTWLRRFNSPILTCVNNMFIEDMVERDAPIDKGYRSIA